MSTFYVNKYPLMVYTDSKTDNKKILPPGNIFVIEYIDCGMAYLKPVKKDSKFDKYVDQVHVIDFAFEKTDSID